MLNFTYIYVYVSVKMALNYEVMHWRNYWQYVSALKQKLLAEHRRAVKGRLRTFEVVEITTMP